MAQGLVRRRSAGRFRPSGKRPRRACRASAVAKNVIDVRALGLMVIIDPICCGWQRRQLPAPRRVVQQSHIVRQIAEWRVNWQAETGLPALRRLRLRLQNLRSGNTGACPIASKARSGLFFVAILRVGRALLPEHAAGGSLSGQSRSRSRRRCRGCQSFSTSGLPEAETGFAGVLAHLVSMIAPVRQADDNAVALPGNRTVNPALHSLSR